MQLSSAPAKLTLPFASSGQKNTIPVASQIGITAGAASYTDGFPPLTMEAVSAGGVPPSGLDFNGIFYALSNLDLWNNTGAGFPYDPAFSTAIGGYPKGARVLQATGSGYWLSIVDNNTTDPDTGGAGWVPEAGSALACVYASTTQSLAVGDTKVLYDTLEYDAAGLWNATNKQFVAKWAGKYRISGSTYLTAPGGQNLAADIFKNGTLTKRCFEFPQVSDVDLSLPFNVIVQCNAADYLDVRVNVTQTAVTAAAGSAYVFAQVEYLGA